MRRAVEERDDLHGHEGPAHDIGTPDLHERRESARQSRRLGDVRIRAEAGGLVAMGGAVRFGGANPSEKAKSAMAAARGRPQPTWQASAHAAATGTVA